MQQSMCTRTSYLLRNPPNEGKKRSDVSTVDFLRELGRVEVVWLTPHASRPSFCWKLTLIRVRSILGEKCDGDVVFHLYAYV